MKLSIIGDEKEMAKRYKNSFRNKVLDYIQTLTSDVILRRDVADLGEPRQVSRALSALVQDGFLLKIGLGIYTKTTTSKYLDKPILKIDFSNACIEALERLGVQWELGQVFKDYNEGRSQQVPMQMVVRLKTRCRRQLQHGRQKLLYERKINAK